MPNDLSPRLTAIVHALPLAPGLRVLEIGCGPGAAARAVVERMGGSGHVMGIDRSAKAVAQAVAGSKDQMARGLLRFRQVAIEHFSLGPDEEAYDIAFAVRVGVLDGRHPEKEQAALANIRRALSAGGRLFLDGGNPLREVKVVSSE